MSLQGDLSFLHSLKQERFTEHVLSAGHLALEIQDEEKRPEHLPLWCLHSGRRDRKMSKIETLSDRMSVVKDHRGRNRRGCAGHGQRDSPGSKMSIDG